MGLLRYSSISSADNPGIMVTMPIMGLSTYDVNRRGIVFSAMVDSSAIAK